MKKKMRPADEENTDRWMVSYADFVTLLFAFFTVMYAISHVDKGKLAMFTGSMQSAFGPNGAVSKVQVIEGITPVPRDVTNMEKDFSKAIVALGDPEEVSVHLDTRGVVISLGDHLLFDSGDVALKTSAIPVLNALASVIKKLPNKVIIEGHTDNVPVNGLHPRYPSNWELSTERATHVLAHFLKNHDISPMRFSAAGYAEFRPVSGNETPEGRSKNRRVDIVVVSATP